MINDQTIALRQLRVWARNVRDSAPGAESDAEMVASVRTHGVIQSLLVRESQGETTDDGAPIYEVGAGGRRLVAAQAVARERGDEDASVPCRVATGEDAEEGRFLAMSLTENTVREDLHIVDEVRSYRALERAGASAAHIARVLGAPVARVRQRLKLAAADDTVLDAHRNGEIGRKTLEAFALCADAAEQRKLLERMRGQHIDEWVVRRALLEDKMSERNPIARYVGVDAYVAAGGTLTEDLFPEREEERIWIGEPERMRAMAQARLDARADEMRAAGWAWAETDVEGNHAGMVTYERLERRPAQLEVGEKAELHRLEEALESAPDGERHACAQALESARRAIDARRTYDGQTMARSGVIVGIAPDGSESIEKGLVRPGKIETNPQGEKPREAPKDMGPSVRGDLRWKRNEVIRSVVAEDPTLARDLLSFQLARALLGAGAWSRSIGIAIEPESKRGSASAERSGLERWAPQRGRVASKLSALPTEWARINRGDGWRALRQLPEATRAEIAATCIAMLVQARLASDDEAQPELEEIARASAIDWRAEIGVDAASFWGRIPRECALEIAGEILGARWKAAHGRLKRSELAPKLEQIFEGNDPEVDGDARARALRWTPEGIAPRRAGAPEASQGADGDAAEPEPSAAAQRTQATPPRGGNGEDETPRVEAAHAEESETGSGEPEPAAGGQIPAFIAMEEART